VLTAKVFEDTSSRVLDDPAAISDNLGNGGVVWVDLLDPTDVELECMREEFSLHPLAIEDAQHKGQRPKLELYPDHAFMVVYASDNSPADLREVHLFIGPDWLVSVRATNANGDAFDPGPAERLFERTRNHTPTVGFLLYRLLDWMVDEYFDALDHSEDVLERVESDLFDEDHLSNPADIQRRLLGLRRDLMLLRRRVMPMRDVILSILRDELPWVEEPQMPYFQDVFDHLLRVVEQVDIQRELLNNVVDAQLGLEANRMNKVMKKMTSWGAILIVATLIAGIYGMNFQDMPELRWRYGYYVALGSMVFVTTGLYFYFKRKDWL
jgi:magnesium transporter